MSYKGQTAFLTGGASGIGRAVTKMLVGKGIRVYVADRDLKGAQAVAEELNTGDKAVWTVQIDVADWDSQRSAWETAEAEFKRIDYVFPIAGIGERRSFPNRPNSAGYEKPDLTVLEVDCIGVIYTVSLAVQHFRRQQPNKYGFRGKIMPVASVCGFYIHQPIPIYTAAKHAVVGLVRSYGKILAEEKITLNAVCPNKIRTGISTAAVYDKAEKLGVLVPIEKLLEAFESLMGENPMSGECLEVAPQLGVRVVQFIPFINEESKISADMTYERSHYLHEPIMDDKI
ncbi:uncharacterized protein A1O5_06065 [Cladophialophora psammophila CBS 110553]|uniref:15-hydroxyprostaglandin dehydrogenase (NAD) n=1 Tax=Cladophialophora psammophila CBS 110553 TaxID=1182543 RepID=W9WS90_9EURO|nr:uncharacterized protein A1O5_06065 [Cladophialophora psammophila CBS 110553]EXJ71072.1 hypothetical protein A1O5_06065 [Cladophialophora psammophila CBS 110553]